MKTIHLTSYVAMPIVAAAAGFAIGRFTSPAVPELNVIDEKTVVVASPASDNSAELVDALSKLAKARDEIASLSQQVFAEDDEAADTNETAVAENNERGNRRGGFNRMSDEEMEALKIDDPERYERLVREREEREARRAEFLDSRRRSEEQRDSFFANVNIAHMPQKEQEELASFVADYQELRSLAEGGMMGGGNNDGQPPDRQRMMQLGMSVMGRANEVRASLLKASAKEMGFNNSESEKFAESINEIFGATSLMGPGGGGFPGGGGGPGGPGGIFGGGQRGGGRR